MSKKEDRSPVVQQRDKLKDELTIREFKWTPKQIELINLIRRKDSRVIFISGDAGTSKSLVSIYCGLELLNNRRVSELIYSRPILESADSGSKLGYLPGSADLKLEPYFEVVEEKLAELLPTSQINKLKIDQRVNFLPVNFCRGLGVAAKYWVIDEAAGFCFCELVTLLTRIGTASKVIVCADPKQSDLPPHKQGGFDKLFNLFSCDDSKANGIYTFQFTKEDIMRSEICKFIVTKLETINNNKMFI